MGRGFTAAAMIAILGVAWPSFALAAGLAAPTSEFTLHGRFEVGNATLLIGHLRFDPAEVDDPGVVGARFLRLPPGDLVACPIERGSRGIIPILEALDRTCRGGVVHPDAQVRFGARTWVRFAGDYGVVGVPNASMSLFVPGALDGGTLWAAVPSSGGVGLAFEAEALRFAATLSSSEVYVGSGGEETPYNGTGHGFVFLEAGDARLEARGFFGRVPTSLSLHLGPATIGAAAETLEPRTILDVQEAVLGADAREPVRNASSLFADHGRAPHLLNGAILGRLNGTAGGLTLRPDAVALVRFTALDGTLEGDRLRVAGKPRLAITPEGFSVDGESPAEPPWLFASVLWALAVYALCRRPAPPRPPRSWRVLGMVSLPLALVLFDLATARVLGTSGVRVLADGGSAGPGLVLLTFEAAAVLLAWVLVLVPVRVVLARSLPGRSRPWSVAIALALFLLYAALQPAALLALAHLVVRL